MTHRHNWRNEAVKLRSLLLSACKLIESYGLTDQMAEGGDGLKQWWSVQKSLALVRRERKSEFGVLQMAIAAEEEREQRLNDDFSG